MDAFFFGGSDDALYGVSHTPRTDVFRDQAVLICNPIGHEYHRCHRMLVRLSEALAERGYYVLRFDYCGTGDSSGSFEEISLARLIDDITTAKSELQAISGMQKISVVGVRFGALLAALSCESAGFSKMVLWDPVVDGASYVRGLHELRREMLSSTFYYTRPRCTTELKEHEYLGYDFSPDFIQSIQALDQQALTLNSATSCLIYSSESLQQHQQPLAEWNALVIEDMGDWHDLLAIETSITANTVNRYIAEELF